MQRWSGESVEESDYSVCIKSQLNKMSQNYSSSISLAQTADDHVLQSENSSTEDLSPALTTT